MKADHQEILTEYVKQLEKGMYSAFIDGSVNTNLAYKPEFVSNNYHEGRKVLSALENELLQCEEFYISVAFITLGGITPLLQTFKELEERGIPGKILTTNYLNFSEPLAIQKLNELSNLDIRMYMSDDDEGFHTKGYIFKNKDVYRIIVGSSNMTLTALTKNKEWNTKIISTEFGEYSERILTEFQDLWASDKTREYHSFIDEYRTAFEISRKQRQIARDAIQESGALDFELYRLKPNAMQTAFITSLRNLMKRGEKKALLISATGTGKTYAAAFAMRELNQEKVLFLVHREQIAKQAQKSFRKVLGSKVSYGIISGNQKEPDADYLFATVQTMSREETLTNFSKHQFQTIIIDEVHRAGAASYQKIVEYFKPQLLLGMTATPERTDGFDIYSLFDHNIATEIRLQDAMEENLLCPFHYFGITELEVNGQVAHDLQNNETLSLRDFQYLTGEARVKYILREADYYVYSGNRVKGIIFCSRKDLGRELSCKMNQMGKQTVFLSGEDSQFEREQAIRRLTSDDMPRNRQLDYILTVDIFNEGVDIPEINQVILLRPTESPIIFVQQLGRGLRKAVGKEFVVILDFIGAYTNNYMIPIALSGDRSYNKDNIRRYVQEGSRMIPGCSTIHFDKISRKRIFSAIDSVRLNDIKLLYDAYRKLKYQLGRIPSLTDFSAYGSVNITKYFMKFNSYYGFLKKYEQEYTVRLDATEEQILGFISKKLAFGKRPEELLILRDILHDHDFHFRIKAYADALSRSGIREKDATIASAVRNLTNRFAKDSDQKKFSACVFLEKTKEETYQASAGFLRVLRNDTFRKMVEETVEFGLEEYQKNYSNRYKDTNFQLYRKYTYEEVCLLLNWDKNMNAQNLGGYFYDARTKTLPVFINYDKTDDAIAYEDRFLAADRLIALSKHPRKITSSDADHFYKRTEADRENRIFLFLRKNKDDREAKEFYFLGEMQAQGDPKPIRMKFDKVDETGAVIGTRIDDAFEVDYQLEVPVRQDLYNYIVKE